MKSKQFTLLQLFTVIDEKTRMSTNIDDVKTILSHLFGIPVTEGDIPAALRYLREHPPLWFNIIKNEIKVINSLFEIKNEMDSSIWDFLLLWHRDNFKEFMTFIETEFNTSFEIPELFAEQQEEFKKIIGLLDSI
jgi:hypothetical protein